MANFCPNCGHPAKEGDRFCVVCGHKLSGVAAQRIDIERAKAETAEAVRILCGGNLPDYPAAAQHVAEAEKNGAGAETIALKDMIEYFKKIDALRRVQSKFLPLGTKLPEGATGMKPEEYMAKVDAQKQKADVLPLRQNGAQNQQNQQNQQGGPSFLKTAAAGFAGAAAGTMVANALSGSHGTTMSPEQMATQEPQADYAAAPASEADTAQTDSYTGADTTGSDYTDTSADTGADSGYTEPSADTDPGYEDLSSDTDSSSDGGGFFDNLFGGGGDGGDDGGFFGGGDDGGFFGGDDGGWF